MKTKWIMIAVITIAAVMASCQWGMVMFHWPMSHLWGGNETAPTRIRAIFSNQVINPDNIHAATDDDIEVRWIYAETKARMGLIWMTWGMIIGGIVIVIRK